ncbi:DUF3237 family protein [Streptomycetaceae bacterium NBC_01309]
MRVVVAGGGIGGLTAALSLHAAGIPDVVVLEAAPEIRPLGVGINLLPHAVRELAELGLGDRLADLGVATAELAYHSRHGQVIWAEPRGVAAGYRWPQYSLHRGKLQMALLDAVRDRLGRTSVRTGAAVASYTDVDRGVRAHLADGTSVDGDVLVAADGIRSAVRRQLFPAEGPPPWNGLVLWRGTTRVPAPAFLGGRTMIMAGDGTEKFVAYPLTERPDATGHVLLNWIAERPLDTPPPAPGDWNRPADPADILRHFGDWRFDWLDIPAVIAGADAVFEYPMVDRDPLPRWTHGRTTLLGDAAHAMYPIGSNGASQAVLDARVLAYHLGTRAGTPDGIDEALAAYEADRRPATTALQQANRGMGPEVVMRTVHERAPEGFTDIEDVLSLAERTEVAAAYKRTAGFDPDALNSRASYSVQSYSGPSHSVPSAPEPPVPGLDFLARFRVAVDPVRHLGETPWGDRRIIPITGGAFDGPRLAGAILPGGGDWQVVHADGAADIDTRYTLRTHDGALIHLTTTGLRHGPPDVMARLAGGGAVDPRAYYFRLVLRFETGDERYAWLNRTIGIAAGMRAPDAVVYDAYTLT